MKFLAGLIALVMFVVFLGPGFFVVLFLLWVMGSLLEYSVKDHKNTRDK